MFTQLSSPNRKFIVNQPYQVFLIGFIFFIFFSSNLSLSSIDTIIGLKNSSSISLLNFISLSLNSPSFDSITSFTNSKRLFFTFINWFFYILLFKYCLSIIISQNFRFHNLDSLSLYIHENKLRQNILYFKRFQLILSDFK